MLDLPASSCIVLEDSDNGIRAAHAAGVLPIMVPDLKPPAEDVKELAHKIFPDLDSVTEYFQQELFKS